MSEKQTPQRPKSGYTSDDLVDLFKGENDPEGTVKIILYLVGIFLTPITLAGALWGYKRAYNRKLFAEGKPPVLHPLDPFAKASMILFSVVVWFLIVVFIFFLRFIFTTILDGGDDIGPMLIYLAVSGGLTFVLMLAFNGWRDKEFTLRTNMNMFGTARFATPEDLADFTWKEGLFIGGGLIYPKSGHIITVAGTRAGKFTNLIAPNLLGAGAYDGSWFVIDPKGEAAFVTSDFQRRIGQKVHIIDPWGIHSKEASTYNPLDIIPMDDEEYLIDDAAMIAEMIVPQASNSKDPFWENKARAIITGFIVYEILEKKKTATLTAVWRNLRLDPEEFKVLMGEMSVSENELVRTTAFELLNIISNSDKLFASIISSCQEYTDFLKSPALQRSVASSSFDIKELSDGRTTIYVIIPADKLASQGKWLRLVTATALRAVVRNKNNQVTFILDEFASLGKLDEIPTYMAVGAGYNITIWPILQTLMQLEHNYGSTWESFLGNAAVKQYFGVGDNFTAKYISTAAGESTYMVYDKDIIGPDKGEPHARALVTSDEVRRGTADEMLIFIEQRPMAVMPKMGYYHIPGIQDEASPNPYYQPKIVASV